MSRQLSSTESSRRNRIQFDLSDLRATLREWFTDWTSPRAPWHSKGRAAPRRRALWGEQLEGRQLLAIDLVSAALPGLSVGGNSDSYDAPSLSADGRYVAFTSYASNLVAGDTNGVGDIFVRDLVDGTTTRVSVADDEAQANYDSYYPSLSADGRYVAFQSYASNLVAGDTNGTGDIFVRDLVDGTTTRVSVADDEAQANDDSHYSSLSADGRYVAFMSNASNLVAGDTNGTSDIFVRDLVDGTITRVSVADDEAQANSSSHYPSLSANGRYVAFVSGASNLVAGDTNGVWDIFVRDLVDGTTTRVSVADDEAQANSVSYYQPSLSADGRYVAFTSWADNLVPEDTNGTWDIFVRDLVDGTITRVSVADDEAQANSSSHYPSLSADGRFVAFQSYASNLVVGDANGAWDIFVRDLVDGTTTRVSVADDEAQANSVSYYPSLSADGRYVAFQSYASNLVAGDANGAGDIFVRDLVDASTVIASTWDADVSTSGNSGSLMSSLSADGRYVAFLSYASNLVAGDTNNAGDIFVRDLGAGTTSRVSVADDEAQANSHSELPNMSADGRYVAFMSYASNLVAGDTNGTGDIFVRDLVDGTTTRVSVADDEAQANSASYYPSLSADGRYVAFQSYASNLVAGDTNNAGDIFVRDLGAGTRRRRSPG
ncbi:MAG: hypothetical protein U0939_09235 [Pirellulales bacterium]